VGRSRIDVNAVVELDDLPSLRTTAEELDLVLWLTAASSRAAAHGTAHDELAAACYGSPRLLPVPVVVPAAGRPDAAGELAGLLETSAIRVARLCPATHRYPLVDWVLSPLPELCDTLGVALLLDFAPAPIDWAAAVALARAYPTVPFLVLDCDVSLELASPAALDAALNLVLHVDPASGHDDVQRLAGVFGRRRFVRGSATQAFAPESGHDGPCELDDTAAELAAGTYAATWF
jgi:hypothetical protein